MNWLSRVVEAPGRMLAAAKSAAFREAKVAANADFERWMQLANGQRVNAPRRGQAEALEFYTVSPIFRSACRLIQNAVASTRFRALVPTKAGQVVQQGPADWYHLRQEWSPEVRQAGIRALENAGECADVAKLNSATLAQMPGAKENGIGNILGRNLAGMYDGRTLIGQSQLYRLVVGEVAWVLASAGTNPQTGRSVPVGAMAIPPTWIIETPRADFDAYRLSRYGWQEAVPADRIVWHREPDLVDPLGRGLGATKTLATELEIDEQAAGVMREWMTAGGIGSTMVNVSDSTADPEKLVERWKKSARDRGKGVPFFFKGGEAVVRELQNMAAVTGASAVREAEFDMVRAYFGLPPELFGKVDNSNRSTIDAAWTIFCQVCLIPELEFWRSFLQSFCDFYFGEGIYLIDYPSPIPENRDLSLAVAQAFPSAFTLAELRKIAGHAPFADDRDKLIIVPPGVRLVSDLEAEANQEPIDPGKLEDPPEE